MDITHLSQQITNFDISILRFFNRPIIPELNFIFIFLIYSVYPFIVFLAYYFYRHKERNNLFRLIIASMVGYLIVISLKMLISRPRPYESYQDILEIFGKADPSFPSAHAFISFLSFYFLPTSFPKWAKTISALYLLIFIPIGSMYIGVHYPTDLIFGALLGVLVPFALQDKITNRLYKKIFK